MTQIKGISTSFTASPRTKHQLSVITAYNRLPSKSKMLTKLIEMEYAFVLGALDMARKMEEDLKTKTPETGYEEIGKEIL